MKSIHHTLIALTCSTAIGGLLVSPVRAAGASHSTRCYFFEEEQLSIDNICRVEGSSWTGGGYSVFTWEDGVSTLRTFGHQGRGNKTCRDFEDGIDKVCGKSYSRYPTTFKRMSEKEANQFRKEGKNVVACVQLKKKSICWQPYP
jgi:hypothetical protein